MVGEHAATFRVILGGIHPPQKLSVSNQSLVCVTFNASLVVFSCILLKVNSSHRAPGPSGNELARLSCPSSYKMLEMLRHLQIATGALHEISDSTKSAVRVRATLAKYIQICMTLLSRRSFPKGPPIQESKSRMQRKGMWWKSKPGMYSRSHLLVIPLVGLTWASIRLSPTAILSSTWLAQRAN